MSIFVWILGYGTARLSTKWHHMRFTRQSVPTPDMQLWMHGWYSTCQLHRTTAVQWHNLCMWVPQSMSSRDELWWQLWVQVYKHMPGDTDSKWSSILYMWVSPRYRHQLLSAAEVWLHHLWVHLSRSPSNMPGPTDVYRSNLWMRLCKCDRLWWTEWVWPAYLPVWVPRWCKSIMLKWPEI